ncbi:MAG TPA: DUF169 domain-containing protein [Terriglobales bacterium]|nr:DUF169 domain-containing protein [Terriglobales bacterium]
MKEDFAATLRVLDDALARYVRPDSFPLAIRMLKPGEEVPKDIRIPSKTMGEQWIVCQSIGIARRYGWGIAVGKDDVICPLAAIAFGFRKPNEEYLKGFVSVGMYCKDEEAAANLEASTWRFDHGAYDYVCVAPLNRATFEPHVIAVYANSAQVLRLVHASLYKRGGRVVSTAGGRLDCAEIVIQTLTTNEPKVILPCTGDRVFGMAQDNEMVFAFPWAYAHEIVEGLEGTHKGGTRYPITVAMRDTVTMPKSYQDLMKMLADRDAGAANKGD